MSACLLCGSRGSELLFHASDRLYHITAENFTVVRCAQCGLVRIDPPPPPAELGRYYPETYWFAPGESAATRLEETYRRIVLGDHVRFVERALRSSSARGRLLDVGCGGGLFLGMMRGRGFHVAGLDYSPSAAGIAWHQQHAPAVAGDLARAPFGDHYFAGITMFHVLEHLYDPRAYIESARDLLQPDGRLVVQVPNAASWQAKLLGPAWTGYDVPRHLFDFGAQHLERLLESCGFEVLRRKHFSLRDNPAGLASSLAPGLDPMARRVRHILENPAARIAKDLVYLALTVAALPFAVLEAACGAGSTIMLEARPR
jgi:SAM-dependent methyltransferase